MEPDCIALWEPPPEDHAAWQGLTGEAMTHEEYLTLLAAVQADQERQGRTVRRARFSVARMRQELSDRDWPNDPPHRAAVTGLVAAGG